MTTTDRNPGQPDSPGEGEKPRGAVGPESSTKHEDSAPRPPADGPRSLSDADWEEFQRAAEQSPAGGGTAPPREPSARARLVTARLRALDEEPARQGGPRRRGRRTKEPEPWQPPGWRTGPAWQDRPGGRRPRRPLQWMSAALLLAMVAWTAKVTLIDGGSAEDVAAPAREWLDSAFGDGDGGLADDPARPVQTLPPETAPPSEAPAAGAGFEEPTLEHPYRGSPALAWAEGADAIELPEAQDTGGVPAADIAEGLRLTKEFLVAAHLDPEVLAGGEPTAALALIDPGQRELADAYRAALDAPTAEADPTSLFTRFDPGEARPVDVPVKVRGHMKVETGTADGQVLIRADYSFVYPLARADGSGEVTRTVVRRELDVLVVRPGLAAVTPGHVWLSAFRWEAGGVTCGSDDGLLHPHFAGDPAATEPTGPAVDPYDRSRSLEDAGGECGTVTRI
ncbi:hypothetical protein [Streptomyces aidingensis]|uniref:Uncharacterized protein n=1 Tax=Streptomyces aidingensis TaxID=910347 RepID=A0A1I1FU24_9ACTN|nr:hypothetical protein [Streptomyces aidingensis]SFC02805.1 hypothetical protein SAMN05421773_101870 [Streptomyces aidingensis]